MDKDFKYVIPAKTLEQAAQGDLEALYQVVFVHCRQPLLLMLARFQNGCDDSWVDERLYDYYFYLIDSVKRGCNKLANLDKEQNVVAFITTICRNWCTDEWRALRHQPKGCYDMDVLKDEEDYGVEQKSRKEEHFAAFVSAIMSVKDMKARERYILLTYIIYEYQKTGTTPLYLSKRLAMQLGMSEAAVKMAYRRSMDKLIANAHKSLNHK